MPRKVFTAGEVLAAADVNEFLQDQAVMSFAGTAARGSAIGTAVEGMVTYLEDSNSLSVYNGTDWTIDRTIQVFAGTAARGSAIPSPVEGMYAHINDTDTLQYYNGSAWANAGGGGKILQVVTATTSTQVETTSTSYVTGGLSATITPSSTSSKIAVFVSTGGRTSNNSAAGFFTIFRGTVAGTDLAPTTTGFASLFSLGGEIVSSISISVLDSPNTTSAQTYTLGIRVNSGTGVRAQNNSALGSIILMEVAG